MTLAQKYRYIKVLLGTIYYSIGNDGFAYRSMMDSSVGFYLRNEHPDLYKQYMIDHTDNHEGIKDILDILVPTEGS